MKFVSEIKSIEENIVYFRHGTIPTMENLFDFVLESGEKCQKLNPTLTCKDYCYITYSASEYKDKDIELEYVEATNEFGKEDNEIKFRVDPKIKALCVAVKGSYSNLPQGYDFALNEVKNKNISICYINCSCWNGRSIICFELFNFTTS